MSVDIWEEFFHLLGRKDSRESTEVTRFIRHETYLAIYL